MPSAVVGNSGVSSTCHTDQHDFIVSIPDSPRQAAKQRTGTRRPEFHGNKMLTVTHKKEAELSVVRRPGELRLGLEESTKGHGAAPEVRQQLGQRVPTCHAAGREGGTTQFFWHSEGRRKAREEATELGD